MFAFTPVIIRAICLTISFNQVALGNILFSALFFIITVYFVFSAGKMAAGQLIGYAKRDPEVIQKNLKIIRNTSVCLVSPAIMFHLAHKTEFRLFLVSLLATTALSSEATAIELFPNDPPKE